MICYCFCCNATVVCSYWWRWVRSPMHLIIDLLFYKIGVFGVALISSSNRYTISFGYLFRWAVHFCWQRTNSWWRKWIFYRDTNAQSNNIIHSSSLEQVLRFVWYSIEWDGLIERKRNRLFVDMSKQFLQLVLSKLYFYRRNLHSHLEKPERKY